MTGKHNLATDEKRALIKEYIKDHPEATATEIIKYFGWKVGSLSKGDDMAKSSLDDAIYFAKHGEHYYQKAKKLKQARLPKGNLPRKVKELTEKVHTLDAVMESVVATYEQAKLVPALKKQIWTLENQLAAARNELTILRNQQAKMSDAELRFKAASLGVMVQSGD